MQKRKMGSVFRKLYLLFITIMAIIYLCVIVIFLTYAAAQRRLEMGVIRNSVEQSASVMKEQLDIVADMMRMLVGDNRTVELSRDWDLDSYAKSQRVLGLIDSMRDLQSMNAIIEEISLLFPKQQMELSTATNFSRKESMPFLRKEGDTARKLVYTAGQVRMELWYPLIRSTAEDYVPDYGVRVTLSEKYVKEILELFAVEGQSGGFAVLDTGGESFCVTDSSCGRDPEALLESWRKEWQAAGSEDGFLGKGRCGGESYLFVSESIPAYGITLVAYRNGNWLDSSTIVALLVMGGVILLVGAMFFLMLLQTDITVKKPLQKVAQAFGKVQEGDLSVRISHKHQDEFQYIYSEFNKMVERIQELILNVKEQGELLQNAELIQLQSQINPHFLYNSFYLIRILAKNESYDQIIQCVTSLAKYYRFLNKEVDQNIPLSKEAEHMMNYVSIQQMRFGDKIAVTVGEIPQEAASFKVPKLILQPVMENAYNYGMADILQDGQIRVGYEVSEGFLCVSVEDNGGGAAAENLERMREYIEDYQGRAAGHALSNIARRLRLAYGEGSGVQLEKGELGGLKVVLRMNLSVQL